MTKSYKKLFTDCNPFWGCNSVKHTPQTQKLPKTKGMNKMLYEVKFKLRNTSAQTGIKTEQEQIFFIESVNLQTLRLDFYTQLLKTYVKNGFNIYNVSYQHSLRYEYFSFNFELYGSHGMSEISDIITTVK